MTTSAPDSAPVYYPAAPTGLLRPGIISAALTLIVAGASIYMGHPLFAVFFSIFTMSSIGLPGLNGFVGEFLCLLGASAMRLGVITVLALAAAFLVRPEGLGVMFGLALGQVVLVLNTVIPVMKGLRKQL